VSHSYQLLLAPPPPELPPPKLPPELELPELELDSDILAIV
jgi:hypothetical protein